MMLQIRRFQFHNSPRVLICCDHYLRWSKNWSAVLNVLNTVRKGSTCGCFPHKSLMRSFSGTDCLKSSQSRLPLFVACRCMSTRKTHYEVLGLGKSASSEDIRAAFLKRSKECHPDLNRSNPDNHRQFVPGQWGLLSTEQATVSQALRQCTRPKQCFSRLPPPSPQRLLPSSQGSLGGGMAQAERAQGRIL